jgi:hypothetical protein
MIPTALAAGDYADGYLSQFTVRCRVRINRSRGRWIGAQHELPGSQEVDDQDWTVSSQEPLLWIGAFQ